MLSNRIVRALVGVVFAKAAVATGYYLYQKSLREENLWGKDNDLTPKDKAEDTSGSELTYVDGKGSPSEKLVVKAVVEPKETSVKAPVKKTRTPRAKKVEVETPVVAKKPARKPRVVASNKNDTTSAVKAVKKAPAKKAKVIKTEA